MKSLKHLNAKPRLLLSIGIVLLLLVFGSVLSLRNLAAADQRTAALFNHDMKGVLLANDLAISKMALGRASRDAILNVKDPKILSIDEKSIAASLADVHTQLSVADRYFTTSEEKVQIDAMRHAMPAYETAYADLVDHLNRKDVDGAKSDLKGAGGVIKVLNDATEAARKLMEQRAEKAVADNHATYLSSRTVILAISLCSVIIGIILSLAIASSFSIPLGKAVQALERVAEGDLTTTLQADSKDEVGRMATALNVAVERLRGALQEVVESASSASVSSQQLAAAAESISSGAQKQAASLEETSASLEEITATVRQSADNAKHANEFASGSRDAAKRGQEVVGNAVSAMEEINVASAKIFNIISTIDEIAFQTNLLAVNAAVEAARAGDEGRGFAVVASEVRSLAQRSAGAAKEIKGLIQDSLSRVEKGKELVNRSGETLQGIVGSVKSVTDIVADIAVASQEQSIGVEQVNRAMSQMDQVTQSNSAHTEELSATAQALSVQSVHLLNLMKGFKLSSDVVEDSNPRTWVARKSSVAAFKKKPRVKVDLYTQTMRMDKLPPSNLTPVAAGQNDEESFEEF